ncbi:VP1 [Betapolyomavirus securanorvegicus]|uniref:Major capsid protein VP1 n=1 Tax=Betapolyomavirus securanorvegicus TaxID=1919247 RepID=A0A2Z2DSF0_9POLY|nr:VP1 [Betapolyomavirus securanorvegicus]API13109.1 VP1 [Betapolyomavirus securanorvegicus]
MSRVTCQRKRLGPGRAPVQKLPRVIKKGGVEVLATVPPGPESEYKLEMFLKPCFGNDSGQAGPHYWNHSSPFTGEALTDGDYHVCYSMGQIQLPEISDQCSEEYMVVWECYRMETEVLYTPKITAAGLSGSNFLAVQGTQMYFWAVGGEPLDVMYMLPKEKMKPQGNLRAPSTTHSVYDPNIIREKLSSELYPVEYWTPDPSRNENTRYFGRIVGGAATPPVVTYSNSSTIPLLDENGVGVLCNQQRCYVTCADITGFLHNRIETAHGRFFRLHFRQRRVKNPYTMSLLYKQVLIQRPPQVAAQLGVTEVTIEEGQAPAPVMAQVGSCEPMITQQASSMLNVQG